MSTFATITLDDLLAHRERSERWAHITSVEHDTSARPVERAARHLARQYRATGAGWSIGTAATFEWLRHTYYGASTVTSNGRRYATERWERTWLPRFDDGLRAGGVEDPEAWRRERHATRRATWERDDARRGV